MLMVQVYYRTRPPTMVKLSGAGCFAGWVWGKVKQGELMRKNRHMTYCVVERAVYKANSVAATFAFPKEIYI